MFFRKIGIEMRARQIPYCLESWFFEAYSLLMPLDFIQMFTKFYENMGASFLIIIEFYSCKSAQVLALQNFPDSELDSMC